MKNLLKTSLLTLSVILLSQSIGVAMENKIKFDKETYYISNPDSKTKSFVYYRNFAYKTFGGITGDLAGYFLQICEISMLGVIVLCDILERGVCC